MKSAAKKHEYDACPKCELEHDHMACAKCLGLRMKLVKSHKDVIEAMLVKEAKEKGLL